MAIRQMDLRLYLDVIPDPSKPEPTAQHIMIFLKHFDTSKQTLTGIGKVYVGRMNKVVDLVPLINERMRWPPGTSIKLYEVGYFTSMHPGYMLNHGTGNQARNDRVDEV